MRECGIILSLLARFLQSVKAKRLAALIRSPATQQQSVDHALLLQSEHWMRYDMYHDANAVAVSIFLKGNLLGIGLYNHE